MLQVFKLLSVLKKVMRMYRFGVEVGATFTVQVYGNFGAGVASLSLSAGRCASSNICFPINFANGFSNSDYVWKLVFVLVKKVRILRYQKLDVF